MVAGLIKSDCRNRLRERVVLVKSVGGSRQNWSRASVGSRGEWSSVSVGTGGIGQVRLRDWAGLVENVCGTGRDWAGLVRMSSGAALYPLPSKW